MKHPKFWRDRRTFLLSSISATFTIGTSEAVSAEGCGANRITELKDHCLDILRDIAATIQTGRSLEEAAWNKAQAAIEPSYNCAKGAYDLGKALFADCNPSSPAVNPAACIETLVGVPDTISACEGAITLVHEAWSLYEQAAFIFGTADVAFYDQGGGEIVEELDRCGESNCAQLGRAVTDYARRNQERTLRNRDRLRDYEKSLQNVQKILEGCQKDPASCTEVPEHAFPGLEPASESPPRISFQ